MDEKQRVVIAVLETEYEGYEYIGVFLSIDGAKAACEKNAAAKRHTEPLKWVYQQPDLDVSGNQSAALTSYTQFYVFWDDVES